MSAATVIRGRGDVEVQICGATAARWVGLVDRGVLVAFAPLQERTGGRYAHLFVPAGSDADHLTVVVACTPAGLMQ